MNINIYNRDTLNAFVSKLAPQIKPGANALKTAIAHAYDYPHITAFEAALAHDGTNNSTPIDMAAVAQRQHDFDTFDSTANVLANAELDNTSDLDVSHWEDAEDSLVLDANALASSPQLAHALTVLEQHGLTDIAGHIGSIAINSKDLSFLKSVV